MFTVNTCTAYCCILGWDINVYINKKKKNGGNNKCIIALYILKGITFLKGSYNMGKKEEDNNDRFISQTCKEHAQKKKN